MLPMRPKNWPHHWKPNGKKAAQHSRILQAFLDKKRDFEKKAAEKCTAALKQERRSIFRQTLSAYDLATLANAPVPCSALAPIGPPDLRGQACLPPFQTPDHSAKATSSGA